VIERAAEPVTSERFREVIGHFASGVTIVTAAHAGAVFASTASAVTSLSDDPPMLLVCMNRSSETGRALDASGRFAINVLDLEQRELALALARKGADKLARVALRDGETLVPVLEDCLAVLECTVTQRARAATHVVFLAEVDAVLARTGEPLVYFRGRFGRLGALA
jgi:4-nitrophenol 2-monooxygenase / 4-nitrocatechol 4-monooxygenase, reductase component